MGHDCSMGPGGSGGPLFFGEGSNARIAAVNTRGVNGGVYRGYTVQNANIATMNQQLINAVIQLKNKFDSQ